MGMEYKLLKICNKNTLSEVVLLIKMVRNIERGDQTVSNNFFPSHRVHMLPIDSLRYILTVKTGCSPL